MKINDTPEYIRADLLERLGADQGDMEMTAEEAFDEYCSWHGLHGWGPKLRAVLYDLKQADFQGAD